MTASLGKESGRPWLTLSGVTPACYWLHHHPCWESKGRNCIVLLADPVPGDLLFSSRVEAGGDAAAFSAGSLSRRQPLLSPPRNPPSSPERWKEGRHIVAIRGCQAPLQVIGRMDLRGTNQRGEGWDGREMRRCFCEDSWGWEFV
jgi:hypothetical protein